jgi:signal recognition particle receptor subunit beta
VGTLDRAARSIHGKIVYFGAPGAGKTANLELLARKLKPEHRGDLKVLQGNQGAWEHLPVSLGEVRGWHTSLDIWAVPGGEGSDAVRAELLDDADGIAFIADLRRDRHAATLAALEELLALLGARGRSLDDVALVIQYNHRDGADETAVEQLHRRLGLGSAVSFDAVAVEGKGVLQTLSALSKQVLSLIRMRAEAPSEPQAAPAAAPVLLELAAPESYGDTALDASVELEAAPLDAGTPLERQWQVRIAGEARAEAGALVVPLRLCDAASGEELALELMLRLAGSSAS